MEFIIAAANPATGTEQFPIWIFIVSGVFLAGCIVFGIVSANMKKKKNSSKKRNVRRK